MNQDDRQHTKITTSTQYSILNQDIDVMPHTSSVQDLDSKSHSSESLLQSQRLTRVLTVDSTPNQNLDADSTPNHNLDARPNQILDGRQQTEPQSGGQTVHQVTISTTDSAPNHNLDGTQYTTPESQQTATPNSQSRQQTTHQNRISVAVTDKHQIRIWTAHNSTPNQNFDGR